VRGLVGRQKGLLLVLGFEICERGHR
jgi:hypothetical protein